MAVTVRRNFAPLTSVEWLSREDWRLIGLLARERITLRTIRGISVDGSPFKPYSEGYAKTRRANAMDSAQVTLQVSGAMLRGIKVRPLRRGRDWHGVELHF